MKNASTEWAAPCPTCKAALGHACVTASGRPAPTHVARLELLGLPVPRRKGTPMGKPRDYAWYVGCPTCGAAAEAPCAGRSHGYHKSRVLAGETYRVAHALPSRKRQTR